MTTRFTYFSHCTDTELVALWSYANKMLKLEANTDLTCTPTNRWEVSNSTERTIEDSKMSREIDYISQNTINKINHGLLSWDDIITRPKNSPAETLAILA